MRNRARHRRLRRDPRVSRALGNLQENPPVSRIEAFEPYCGGIDACASQPAAKQQGRGGVESLEPATVDGGDRLRHGRRHVHALVIRRNWPAGIALAGKLERGLGAGGRLEKQVDLRTAAKARPLLLDLTVEGDEFLGEIEETGDLGGGKPLDPEQVPAL